MTGNSTTFMMKNCCDLSTSKPKILQNYALQNHNKNKNVLPTALDMVACLSGLRITREYNFKPGHIKKNRCFQRLNASVKLNLIFSHALVFCIIIEAICNVDHPTFIISTFLDIIVYLIGLDIFLYRRKKLYYCINYLLKFPDEYTFTNQKEKYQFISILVCVAMLYASIYTFYGSYIYINRLISTVDKKYYVNSLILFNWFIYCLFAYFGMSIHIIIFTYLCSLTSNALGSIIKNIDNIFIRKSYCCYFIHLQRHAFSRLQMIVSKTDSIFNEIILIWLGKIIFRCCLSTIDIFTKSVTTEDALNKGITVLDTIFDIFHLFIICNFGGNIYKRKQELLESLIELSGKSSGADEIRNEFHLLVSLVGNSNLSFTAADIFPISKRMTITIMGILSSYSILIYQLKDSNEL